MWRERLVARLRRRREDDVPVPQWPSVVTTGPDGSASAPFAIGDLVYDLWRPHRGPGTVDALRHDGSVPRGWLCLVSWPDHAEESACLYFEQASTVAARRERLAAAAGDDAVAPDS